MKNIVFIINGAKKPNKKLKKILDFFSNSSFFHKVDIKTTQYRGHAEKIASQYSLSFDYIIAVGGDGTLNEIINGINLNANIIVGLLPYGTGNDFARGQKLIFDGQFLFELIKNDCYRSIDIGRIKGLCQKSDLNRRFVNVADIGLGGYVTHNMMKNKNRFTSGHLKYALAILKGIVQYKKSELVIEGDYNFRGKVLTLAVCNSPYFGSGLCIAPNANVENRTLQVTRIGDVSLIDYFKNLGKIKKGILIEHPEIHYATIQKIEVRHTAKPSPVEVDGEFIGYTPVDIEVLSDTLKFLLPQQLVNYGT